MSTAGEAASTTVGFPALALLEDNAMTTAKPTGQLAASQVAVEEVERPDCVWFGCTDPAVWIVTHPRGGLLPYCDPDLDQVLNDALAYIPPHSSARIEIHRP
jgi:hypothetical protein